MTRGTQPVDLKRLPVVLVVSVGECDTMAAFAGRGPHEITTCDCVLDGLLSHVTKALLDDPHGGLCLAFAGQALIVGAFAACGCVDDVTVLTGTLGDVHFATSMSRPALR